MDRREFLTARRKASRKQPDSIQQVARTLSGITPYNGPWGTEEIVHLLKRTMFGAKPDDVTHFKLKGMSQSVDELLGPSVASLSPSPPVKEYEETGAANPDTTVAAGTTWINTYSNDGTIESRRRASFKKWSLGLMINQERNIVEKMTLFWHNHFATETVDINSSIPIYKHHALLRANALGNFKTLVKDVTLDVAMLRYLNGYANTKTAPDENYARELQELFTLGKENNPNYTEDDVKAAARVLTGWRVDLPTSTSSFDINRHDTTNKTFSSFYGGTIVTGRTGATAGGLELDDLLTMIFNKKEEVSRFIVTKLYRWFCYYTIDAATKTNVIEPLAKIFRDNNWDIKPVLATLLKSEHFFDVLNRGCIIKSPLEITVNLCREFSISFPNASTEYPDAYGMWDYIRAQASSFNQNFADPPSVAGWPSYYQEPQFYELWVNTDTLPKRNRFTDQMVVNGYSRNGKSIKIDPIAFAKKMSNPGDPNILLSDVVTYLYRVPLSQTSRDTIKKNILLSGQDQDYYWSNAWNSYIANPADNMAFQTVNTRLRDLLKYFMNLAEYHLA
jgi:uncharacterized protein (DUF1800 family)